MSRPLPSAIVNKLGHTVGSENVITDPDRLVVYESDGLSAYRVPPRAVVLPKTTREVAEVVAVLHGEGIDVIPRGSGTGLSGGALATPDGVVLGTARMEHDSEYRL